MTLILALLLFGIPVANIALADAPLRPVSVGVNLLWVLIQLLLGAQAVEARKDRL